MDLPQHSPCKSGIAVSVTPADEEMKGKGSCGVSQDSGSHHVALKCESFYCI